MRPYSSFGVLCLVLVGCSSTTVVNNGSDAGPSSSSGSSGATSSSGASSSGQSSSGATAATPASGVWHYSQVQRTNDTCHIPQLKDPSGDFTIAAGAGGSFVVTPGDGTDPFTCTASGGKFDCPDRAAQTVTAQGVNAVVTGHATASGDVVNEAQLNGTQNVQVTCTGSDCGTVASAAGTTFPCTIAITFVATKK